MASRLTATAARSARADSSLAERTALAERVSSAYEKGEAISIDIAQDPHNLAMFTRYAEQYGGDSAAAHLLMSAELARQSLKPNRTFSDGTGCRQGSAEAEVSQPSLSGSNMCLSGSALVAS
jgi:conjugal transfer mating pair stabilization protein TraG